MYDCDKHAHWRALTYTHNTIIQRLSTHGGKLVFIFNMRMLRLILFSWCPFLLLGLKFVYGRSFGAIDILIFFDWWSFRTPLGTPLIVCASLCCLHDKKYHKWLSSHTVVPINCVNCRPPLLLFLFNFCIIFLWPGRAKSYLHWLCPFGALSWSMRTSELF